MVTGKGKILVMDDEEIIRNVAAKMLNHVGYEVVLAEDGNRAIELYSQAVQAGQPFDAVILDLTVRSGLGGKETLARLREIHPELKAVVSSGYSNDPVMSEFEKYGFAGVIAKPYKVRELGETIGRIVGKEKTGA